MQLGLRFGRFAQRKRTPAVCDHAGDPIRPWDFAVDPSDPNIILVGTNGFLRTTNANAGANATWSLIRGQSNFRDLHFDQRAIAFSEATPGLAYVGNDGGIWKSAQHGAAETWDNLNQNLPGSLLYGAALSQDGSLMAGTQDNGAVFSNVGGAWTIVLGGDAWGALIDPANSTFSYYITNGGNGTFRRYKKTIPIEDAAISPPGNCSSLAWSLNPLDGRRLTIACQPVARTSNATVSPPTSIVWQSIQAPFVPYAVREAPNDPNVIYALANGNVWVTINASSPTPHWDARSLSARQHHHNPILVTRQLPMSRPIRAFTRLRTRARAGRSADPRTWFIARWRLTHPILTVFSQLPTRAFSVASMAARHGET